jgi:Domain of unknown function (DUF4861)
MKKILFVGLFSFCLSGVCSMSYGQAKVTVKNPKNSDRLEEVVSVPLASLSSKISLNAGESYVVEDATGNPLVSQVTSDRHLIFMVQLKSKENAVFNIKSGQVVKAGLRAYGKYHPERKDDFAWENDKVGFRVYGKALVPVDGPSNGIDLWYKRTNKMVLDEWYGKDKEQQVSFHVDHGEGMDVFAVGRSLGAGAMAPFLKDTLWLNQNYQTYQVLDNGPLRVRFRVNYLDVAVGGKKYKESREFVLDAGASLTKVIQTYEGADAKFPVAAGIFKHENDSVISSSNYLVYKEPSSASDGDAYVALVFPYSKIKTVLNTYTTHVKGTPKTFSHVLAVTNYSQPTVYYTGYGWSKAWFPTVRDYHNYIVKFTEQICKPLKVSVK